MQGGQALTIELPKPKASWLSRIGSLVVVSLLLYLAAQYLTILLENKLTLAWWKNNGGAAYHRYISLMLLFTYYQGSALGYWLLALFLPLPNQLNGAAISFITGSLLSHIRLPSAEGKQVGILTPKQLCQTILLHSGDGDEAFDKWLKQHPERKQGEFDALDPEYCLQFDPPTVYDDGLTLDYTNKAKTLRPGKFPTTYYGVYPAVGDYPSWRGCLQAWANGGLDKPATFVWKRDARNKNIYVLTPADPNKSASLDAWYNQPDNVFGRYGISLDSPFITFYATGNAYLNGVPVSVVDGAALENLVGANFSATDAGGWLGFIQGRGAHAGVDDFYNLLYKSVDFSPDAPVAKRDCNHLAAGAQAGATALFSSGLSFLFVIASGASGGVIAIGAALVAGLTGIGFLDGFNRKC